MLPDKMRIGLWTYAIDVVDQARLETGEAREAVAHNVKRTITITRTALDGDIENTLIHEALHCIDYQMSLGLSEDTVWKLANGIEALLRDNPELVRHA